MNRSKTVGEITREVVGVSVMEMIDLSPSRVVASAIDEKLREEINAEMGGKVHLAVYEEIRDATS